MNEAAGVRRGASWSQVGQTRRVNRSVSKRRSRERFLGERPLDHYRVSCSKRSLVSCVRSAWRPVSRFTPRETTRWHRSWQNQATTTTTAAIISRPAAFQVIRANCAMIESRWQKREEQRRKEQGQPGGPRTVARESRGAREISPRSRKRFAKILLRRRRESELPD